MTADEIRLKCLELAIGDAAVSGAPNTADIIVEVAKKWSQFVIGTPLQETSHKVKAGADDHLAKKNLTV